MDSLLSLLYSAHCSVLVAHRTRLGERPTADLLSVDTESEDTAVFLESAGEVFCEVLQDD